MDLFRRRPTRRRADADVHDDQDIDQDVDQDDRAGGGRADAQSAALLLADVFFAQDRAMLAALSSDARAAQFDARAALYEYVNRMWQAPKVDGIRPPLPGADGVAGMRDLTYNLLATVHQAQLDAGDEKK